MAEFNKDEIEAIRTWYSEWVKIPTYLTSASLGFLAFSLTNLIPKALASTVCLKAAWILLSLAAVLAGIGLLGAYCSFDVGIRLHLSRVMQRMDMTFPARNTRWISRWGMVSFFSTGVALSCLLAGAVCLTIHVLGVV